VKQLDLSETEEGEEDEDRGCLLAKLASVMQKDILIKMGVA
jgi:hypothetical protein